MQSMRGVAYELYMNGFIKAADSGVFIKKNGSVRRVTCSYDHSAPKGDDFAKSILSKFKKMNAMIIASTEYCGICISKRTPIPAILDDMAQIIGVKSDIVNKDVDEIVKALKGATAVLVDDGDDSFIVVLGRDIQEAHTAMNVLEKTAEVYIKADVIGGAKKLPTLKAKTERFIYYTKYSKGSRKRNNENKR